MCHLQNKKAVRRHLFFPFAGCGWAAAKIYFPNFKARGPIGANIWRMKLTKIYLKRACLPQNFYSYDLYTCEANIGRSAIQRPNWVSFFCWCGFRKCVFKVLEWSVPMWCANLDLRKPFDRIEYNALFDALKVHWVPHVYLKLIPSLYHDQVGLVQGKHFQSNAV